MDCLFCKIIEGKIPSTKVFESSTILGFKDISPQAPTHYLFVPKKHFDSLADVSESEIGIVAELLLALKQTADKEGISERGYRTVINTNKEGGQTVWHLHVHLIAGKQLGGNMAGI